MSNGEQSCILGYCVCLKVSVLRFVVKLNVRDVLKRQWEMFKINLNTKIWMDFQVFLFDFFYFLLIDIISKYFMINFLIFNNIAFNF